ncbi:MAG: hypothetical protein WD512_05705, partial [Candidatus Paceibacterota bacterium]
MYYLLPVIRKIYENGKILGVCLDKNRLETWLNSLESPFMASMIRLHLRDLTEEMYPHFGEEKLDQFRASINSIERYKNPLPLLIFLSMFSDKLVHLNKIIRSLKYINTMFSNFNQGTVSSDSLDDEEEVEEVEEVEEENEVEQVEEENEVEQ